MNHNDVCKFPSIEGRGERSLGCDDGRFISLKENSTAVYRGGSPILRPYTKSELATMYFPIGSTSNALRRLNRYINNAHGLLPALLATGYRVNDRHFTRRQVQLIFEYLGEP